LKQARKRETGEGKELREQAKGQVLEDGIFKEAIINDR